MKNKFFCVYILFFLIVSFTEGQQLFLKWTNPLNVTILNSSEDDFAPVWNKLDSSLYFNSTRDGLSKFYNAKLIDSNKFEKPHLLKGEINNTGSNVSFISFIAEDRAYLSTFRFNNVRPYFNIFETILTREGWSAPLPVDNLINDYNTLQPTISPDGKMLVVASDMNSKEHKTDLFISFINNNGQWCPLQSLDVLNTDGNEITPSFATNDTLFFASDGQGGPGGFDLFYSVRSNNGSWSKPNPLKEINTSYDESDFTMLPGRYAVFASNRPGSKGKFDLYMTKYFFSEFKIPPERMLEISIATQIMTLKTSDDFRYEFFPLINAILSNANESLLNKIFSKKGSDEPELNIDDIYLKSFNIIGKRLNKYSNAGLIIHYTILQSDDPNIKLPDAASIAQRTKDFFINVWNINPKRIKLVKHLKKLSGSELTAYPMIYLDSDNPNVLDYLELGEHKVYIDPPFSDIFIKIKPAVNLQNWVTHLNTNTAETNYFRQSELASDQFSISLTDYSKILNVADSLTIAVTAVNKYSDTITKELHFDLIHSQTKKRKFRIINGIKYEQIYIFLPSGKKLEAFNFLKNITQKISESAEFSKSIKIQFFSASGQERAVEFTSFIKNKMNLPFLPVDVEQAPYNTDLPFSRQFAPYMIRVLIKKL